MLQSRSILNLSVSDKKISMKAIKIVLLLLTLSGIIFLPYVPAQTKQASCCCCSGAVCRCDCSKNNTDGTLFQGPDKNIIPSPCDLNKCANNAPPTARKIFFLNYSDSPFKKDQTTGLRNSASPEKAGIIPVSAFINSYVTPLSLPPPLFIKNTSLLL
jgi:hypothetical protein